MTRHMTGTREQWLTARLELLVAEKELTRHGDELARQRQALPWVRIDKPTNSRPTRGTPRLPTCSRALAAPRLPLHVWARLQGGMSVLLGDRRRLRRLRRSSREPRRHALGGVAGAARQAAGLQAADGVVVSLGVLAQRRLQLRLQRFGHEEQQRHGGVEYNYQRGGHVLDASRKPPPRGLSPSRP